MNHRNIGQLNQIFVLALPAICFLFLFGCDWQTTAPSAENGKETTVAPTGTGTQERPASGGKLPDWSLAEADSSSVGSPYKMSSFEIRPPAGFEFIKYIPESNAYYWVGPIRPDETYPQFFVTITNLPAADANAPLTTSLSEIMGSIKQRRTDWSQTPPEEGKINGLPFIRCSWSGVATDAAREGLSGRTMHGIVYLTVHENQAVQIMCQDVAPDHDQWLKLGGLAALTFRATSAERTSP